MKIKRILALVLALSCLGVSAFALQGESIQVGETYGNTAQCSFGICRIK